MKQTGGKANPALVGELLETKLADLQLRFDLRTSATEGNALSFRPGTVPRPRVVSCSRPELMQLGKVTDLEVGTVRLGFVVTRDRARW